MVPRGSCDHDLNLAITIFNDKLKASLSDMNHRLFNTSFLYSDYFNFMLELRGPSFDQASSNLLNTTSPCCPEAYDGGLTSATCLPISTACKEPDRKMIVFAEEMVSVQEGEDTQFAKQQTRSNQPLEQGYAQKGNYQSSQGTFPGQQMHIPPGFPHQPPQPAPNQEPKLRAMLKQLLQAQADGVMETSKKLADINSKIESLNTRVQTLEYHTSSAAAKQGQLPGKPVQNPKEHCKVIFTQEEGFDQTS
ncbi:unnamed protein product [Microthlaspi erraticum]|uniref:Uncharacterized protein n=1 Tax=Microthlaspi erraticum TaxID=1685480 RepID=A0A6D2JXF9_9BRAS|nr:unnamed protein product [Microthlaspi erraticum]